VLLHQRLPRHGMGGSRASFESTLIWQAAVVGVVMLSVCSTAGSVSLLDTGTNTVFGAFLANCMYKRTKSTNTRTFQHKQEYTHEYTHDHTVLSHSLAFSLFSLCLSHTAISIVVHHGGRGAVKGHPGGTRVCTRCTAISEQACILRACVCL